MQFAHFTQLPSDNGPLVNEYRSVYFSFGRIFHRRIFGLFVTTRRRPGRKHLRTSSKGRTLVANVTARGNMDANRVSTMRPINAHSHRHEGTRQCGLAIKAGAISHPLGHLQIRIICRTALRLLTLFQYRLRVIRRFVRRRLPFAVQIPNIGSFTNFVRRTFSSIGLFNRKKSKLWLPLFQSGQRVHGVPTHVTTIMNI